MVVGVSAPPSKKLLSTSVFVNGLTNNNNKNIQQQIPHNNNDVDNSDQQKHRTVIIGKGTAPHCQRLEYFAWGLSRFVKENLHTYQG
jgi:hypothetical protein